MTAVRIPRGKSVQMIRGFHGLPSHRLESLPLLSTGVAHAVTPSSRVSMPMMWLCLVVLRLKP